MSNLDNWLAEANEQGRVWYSRRHALTVALRRPPLSLAECRYAARFAADTWLTMTRSPAGATEADEARFVDAFMAGAVAARQEQR